MPRTHYIVRLSKRKLIPGTSLAYTRGDEVPASINETRFEDEQQAELYVRDCDTMRYDGALVTIFKVNRKGVRTVRTSGFNNNGMPNPDERRRLDMTDVIQFVEDVAKLTPGELCSSANILITVAHRIVSEHDGSCLAKGA